MYIQADMTDSTLRGPTLAKKDNKGSKKNSQLVLRLDRDERDDFVEMCKQMDTSAAREIRRFIRTFLQENADR